MGRSSPRPEGRQRHVRLRQDRRDRVVAEALVNSEMVAIAKAFVREMRIFRAEDGPRVGWQEARPDAKQVSAKSLPDASSTHGEELLLAAAAGVLFGVSDVAIKYLTHSHGPVFGVFSDGRSPR